MWNCRKFFLWVSKFGEVGVGNRGVHMPSDSKKKWRILLGFQEKKWRIPRDSGEKKWQTQRLGFRGFRGFQVSGIPGFQDSREKKTLGFQGIPVIPGIPLKKSLWFHWFHEVRESKKSPRLQKLDYTGLLPKIINLSNKQYNRFSHDTGFVPRWVNVDHWVPKVGNMIGYKTRKK